MRRHAKQQDERNLELARDATRARETCDAAIVEAELARSRASTVQVAMDAERRVAAGVRDELQKSDDAMQELRAESARSTELSSQKQHALLSEMRGMISELKSEITRLRGNQLYIYSFESSSSISMMILLKQISGPPPPPPQPIFSHFHQLQKLLRERSIIIIR